MDYRLTFEELDQINTARAEKDARGELACGRDDCGEPAAAITLDGSNLRFWCGPHGKREADRLAARDLADVERRGA